MCTSRSWPTRQQAIDVYRELVDQAPASASEGQAQALAALERLYERTERWDDLRELLDARRAGEQDPAQRAELRLRVAVLCEQRLGNPERAIAELRELTGEQPDHARAHDELERLYAAAKRYADLGALLARRAERAAELGDAPGELQRLRSVAAVYESQLGDPERAIATYRRISERAAHDRDALEALLRLHSGRSEWREAGTAMHSLLGLSQGDAAGELALRLAELAEQKLNDPALAESALRQVYEREPERAGTRERLKQLYESLKDYGKLVAVLSDEEQRLADSGQRVALLNHIAALYREQLSDPASAVSYLERAVALAPDDRAALLALCDLYVAAGRPRDAIPVLQKIIESYGARRAKEVALYQHRLGQAHEELGDIDAALQHYDAAFKIDLTSVPILRDLGRLCLQKGDLDRAQKTYRALLLQKLGPDAGILKADVYYHLGEISLKQGDKSKAKAMLERAIAEGGQHAQAKALLETL